MESACVIYILRILSDLFSENKYYAPETFKILLKLRKQKKQNLVNDIF